MLHTVTVLATHMHNLFCLRTRAITQLVNVLCCTASLILRHLQAALREAAGAHAALLTSSTHAHTKANRAYTMLYTSHIVNCCTYSTNTTSIMYTALHAVQPVDGQPRQLIVPPGLNASAYHPALCTSHAQTFSTQHSASTSAMPTAVQTSSRQLPPRNCLFKHSNHTHTHIVSSNPRCMPCCPHVQ